MRRPGPKLLLPKPRLLRSFLHTFFPSLVASASAYRFLSFSTPDSKTVAPVPKTSTMVALCPAAVALIFSWIITVSASSQLRPIFRAAEAYKGLTMDQRGCAVDDWYSAVYESRCSDKACFCANPQFISDEVDECLIYYSDYLIPKPELYSAENYNSIMMFFGNECGTFQVQTKVCTMLGDVSLGMEWHRTRKSSRWLTARGRILLVGGDPVDHVHLDARSDQDPAWWQRGNSDRDHLRHAGRSRKRTGPAVSGRRGS